MQCVSTTFSKKMSINGYQALINLATGYVTTVHKPGTVSQHHITYTDEFIIIIGVSLSIADY